MLNKIFNLHFTDLCNYKCKHCFVKRERNFLTLPEIKVAIDNISNYFRANNITDGKINIAGGEPTTSKDLQSIIDYIVSKGIKATLITNGYKLTESFIANNRNKLAVIGLSIDSLNNETNVSLGRCSGCQNRVLSYEDLKKLCLCIKENGIKLKINTVVNKVNLNEDILPLIRDVNPDRIKFLQMLPVNSYSEKIAISNEEFTQYLKKYEGIKFISEYSADLVDTYMIIDSSGFISTNNQHFDLRFNALKEPINNFVNQIKFNFEGESKRYA